MAPRITIVGGGSVHWAPKLLVDFANTKSINEAEVVLMDIDVASLPPIEKLAHHIREARDIGLSVRTTTDLADSLDGAEFVVSALSVGGFSSMRHDIEIPARHGVRQPVGDSVGPGGIFRSLRSIPVMLGVAREMERRCPDALLINVSNPLTALCRAVTRETSIAAVGLCNEVIGQSFILSLLFGVDMRTIDPVVAGVNHLPLMTGLTAGGEDGFKLLDELLDNLDTVGEEPVWMPPPAATHFRKRSAGPQWTKSDVVSNSMVKLELYKRFGVLPGSSDTHVVEFFPGFVAASSDFGRDWGVHHYGLLGHMADKEADHESLRELMESDEVPRWPSGELVAPLIDGIIADKARSLPVNLPNTGQVENLPEGVVVECMGLANAKGVVARDRVRVPSVLGEQLRRVSVSQELTVEAAIEGNRTKVLEAMLADPTAGAAPYERLVAMTDELLAATEAWLPQF